MAHFCAAQRKLSIFPRAHLQSKMESLSASLAAAQHAASQLQTAAESAKTASALGAAIVRPVAEPDMLNYYKLPPQGAEGGWSGAAVPRREPAVIDWCEFPFPIIFDAGRSMQVALAVLRHPSC